MKLVRESGHKLDGGVNYWPLSVPLACIALWWPILAAAINVHIATIIALGASCLLVIVVALALLAEELGLEDELLHGTARGFLLADQSEGRPQEFGQPVSRERSAPTR